MRVLFIYSDLGSFLPIHFPHGIGYLSAVLKSQGYQTGLFYLSEWWPQEKFETELKIFDPALVAFSSTSHQYPHLIKIAELVKEILPRVPIIFGGVHATLASEELLAHPALDIICRAEGEEPILELAQSLEQGKEYAHIKNLWVKYKKELIKNPLRPLLANLDSLPFSDRELLNYPELLKQNNGRLSLLAGRGCPFSCSYCANQAKKQLYHQDPNYLRFRSVDNLLGEIKICSEKYQIKTLDFDDDIFIFNREWLEEFLEKYPQNFSYPFWVNIHPSLADKEIYQKLADAGCEMVKIGLESGSETVRRKIMNRKITQAQIVNAFQWAEESGIRTWSFNMVGLPEESAEDLLETYKLNQQIFPDHMQVSIFNPYPGTLLYQICQERGYLKRPLKETYFSPETTLEFDSLSPPEIYQWHQRLIRLGQVCRNQKRLSRRLRNQEILLDLINQLYSAKVFTPVPDYYGEEYVFIDQEVQRTLIMHPPCKIRYALWLQDRAKLEFGILMHPEIYQKPHPGGVIFIIRLGKKENHLKEVFWQKLDAKAKIEDRAVVERKVSLSEFVFGAVILELETVPVYPERNQFNTAGFANPVIVREG